MEKRYLEEYQANFNSRIALIAPDCSCIQFSDELPCHQQPVDLFNNQFIGGHKAVARPDPIPNSAVKRSLANGSGCIASARVGRRQFFHSINAVLNLKAAFFCFLLSRMALLIRSLMKIAEDVVCAHVPRRH